MPEEKKTPDEDRMQRVIDPETGREITGEYVTGKLKELEKVAEEIIREALEEYRKNPDSKEEIYRKAYCKIREKLSIGSIGPATALTSSLMDDKIMKLAELLDIDKKNRIVE